MMDALKDLLFDDGAPRDPREAQSLKRDEGGAIMVMGVFMAVLLVGSIYYVMGIGQSIIYHEYMQDAADAGAFGAAVIHARGMNILAFLNIISAAVMAVLVALKVIEYLLAAATAIATAICAACSCPGCCGCCAACPPAVILGYGWDTVSEIRSAAEPPIEAILEANKAIQTVVQQGMPFVAQAKVMDYGRNVYNVPTENGLMTPLYAGGLPAEPDDSGLFCEKASYQGGVIAGTLVGLWPIRTFIGTATQALAPILCEDDEYAHRVEEDAEMGDENFQVAAFMTGDPPFEHYERGMSVVTWGKASEAQDFSALEEFTQISYAQAEFYIDTETNREEWLWRLDWRARLRRFDGSALTGGDLGDLGAAASGISGLPDLNFSVH
jgi:hypothetical protein